MFIYITSARRERGEGLLQLLVWKPPNWLLHNMWTAQYCYEFNSVRHKYTNPCRYASKCYVNNIDYFYFLTCSKMRKQKFLFSNGNIYENCCLNSSFIQESFGKCKPEILNAMNVFKDNMFYPSINCETLGLFKRFTIFDVINKSCIIKISYLTKCYDTSVVRDDCDVERYSCNLINQII